jgi:hypothetical protein
MRTGLVHGHAAADHRDAGARELVVQMSQWSNPGDVLGLPKGGPAVGIVVEAAVSRPAETTSDSHAGLRSGRDDCFGDVLGKLGSRSAAQRDEYRIGIAFDGMPIGPDSVVPRIARAVCVMLPSMTRSASRHPMPRS